LSLDGCTLTILNHRFDLTKQKLYVVAIGKAALSMAAAVDGCLGERIAAGVGSGPKDQSLTVPFPRWKIFKGGHPLPTNESRVAAQETLRLLKRANDDRALVIFLISGGGSAMVEWPSDDRITLEDLREANRTLVTCGATISEINAVRRAFSAIKGGGLSRVAPDTDQITLIVSDTNFGDESAVASGPTLEPGSNAPSPIEVLERYGLAATLPTAVVEAIKAHRKPERLPARGIRAHRVLLDNDTALEAAAKKAAELGYAVEIARDILEQPVEEGSRLLLARMKELLAAGKPRDPICLISGGEFASVVRGHGTGGRNLETVLRCAIEISSNAAFEHIVVLSAGTDGVDGNSPDAGAFADETTIQRASALGLDAQTYLDNSDSHGFFERLSSLGGAERNCLISTGVTGTNVRDVRIILSQYTARLAPVAS
jgi:glycerate 2-kinase